MTKQAPRRVLRTSHLMDAQDSIQAAHVAAFLECTPYTPLRFGVNEDARSLSAPALRVLREGGWWPVETIKLNNYEPRVSFGDEAQHWDEIGHYYRPLTEGSRVMKYEGIATKGNQWVLWQKPGTVMLDAYIADRVYADTLAPLPSYA